MPAGTSAEILDTVLGLSGGQSHSDRNRANVYYADNAREVVEGLSAKLHMPENPVLAAKLRLGMDWILKRRTVLTELGRMLIEDPTEQDIQRLRDAVMHIAKRHGKITAKAASAHVRRLRMGETKRRDRVASLHHDLNAAINQHRQRFPESTWTDVHRALGLTAVQVERKLEGHESDEDACSRSSTVPGRPA